MSESMSVDGTLLVYQFQNALSILLPARLSHYLKSNSSWLVSLSRLIHVMDCSKLLLTLPSSAEPLLHEVKGDVEDNEDEVFPQNLSEEVSVASLFHCIGHHPVSSHPCSLLLDVLRHQPVE